MNARDIIAAARYRATKPDLMPYLSSVLLSLRPVEVPGLGTVAVDAGWRLYYDPAVIESWGVFNQADDGCTAAILHESMHCLYNHNERRRDRDAHLWNVAADVAINDSLREAGIRLPAIRHANGEGSAVYPETFDLPGGLTAEEYYELLLSKAKKVPVYKCGGCAGNPYEWEEKSKDQGHAGEGGEGGEGDGGTTGIADMDQQLLRRATAEAIQQHAKLAGQVPAALKAWADCELTPSRIDWRKRLASLVRNTLASAAGASDYTYSRLSRRQWGMRAVFGPRAPIMPALRSPVPVVKGVLDVSGSMGSGEGSPALAARSEIMGICKALGSPVAWVSCDTQVAARARVGSKRDLAKLADTQGGTDLRVAIRELDQPGVDVVIVLTDGYSPFPARGETRARLIVAITPGGQQPPEHIPCVMIEG